ncbi:MAG: prepilin peptidase [Planctomycetota bacterium]|nr:MAG: prepilin peptidase [Planctomycetota bacterium]
MILGWTFALGAAIGSFLNVVAYRLPRGLNLSRPGSRCPSCGRAIRWYDNVPIAGWLWLRGRCRECRASISPRYPIVEAIAAVCAFVVAWAGIYDMPEVDGLAYALAPVWIAWRLVLVFVLLCAALLEWDGNVAPPRMALAAGLVLLILPVLFPGLRAPWVSESVRFHGLVDSGAAAAAMLLLGLLAWPQIQTTYRHGEMGTGATAVGQMMLVGLTLGMAGGSAATALAAVGVLICLAAACFWSPAARFGWAAWLLAGTLCWTAMASVALARWPERFADPSRTLLVAGVVVAAAAVVSRLLPSRPALTPGDA